MSWRFSISIGALIAVAVSVRSGAEELSYGQVGRMVRAWTERADGLVFCGEDSVSDSSHAAWFGSVLHVADGPCAGMDYMSEAELDASELAFDGFRSVASAAANVGAGETGAGQGTDFGAKGSAEEDIVFSIDETSDVLFITEWATNGTGVGSGSVILGVNYASGGTFIPMGDLVNGGAIQRTLSAGVLYKLVGRASAEAGPTIPGVDDAGSYESSYDVEMVPVPEPSGVMMLLAGAVFAGGLSWGREGRCGHKCVV